MTRSPDPSTEALYEAALAAIERELFGDVQNRSRDDLVKRAAALVARLSQAEEALKEQRVHHVGVQLDNAVVLGAIFDHAREALEAAYTEIGRAEEHHRWHHEQEGRAVEDDDERLRVLMVIAETIEELPEPLEDDVSDQTEQLRRAAERITRAALAASSAGETPDG